ncbi:flavin reductase family protein [Shimia sp. W99]
MDMAPEFDPTAENQRIYRDALGCFATGVTVITAPTASGPIGMTANSFSSISLDPPLVLWSAAKNSQRYPFFAAATRFAIHVMRDDQKALALEFARRGDAFDQTKWHSGAHDVPLIDSCLARFECRTQAVHDGGDHAIVVGEVTHVTLNDGAPLVFAQRAFGGFTPEA